MTFKQWFGKLKRLAKCNDAAWLIGHASAWRGYFEDGYTPAQALSEASTYAERL